MIIEFNVIGKPQGKERPRFTRQGHAYTPPLTRRYQNKVQAAFMECCEAVNCGKTPLYGADKPIYVSITAYYEIPKRWSKKKRCAAIEGRLRPTVKPDTDNIAKIILDSLNGLAYADDKQVVECKVGKWYDEMAWVSVKVREV